MQFKENSASTKKEYLTSEEINILIPKAKEGDQDAMMKIIESNARLVTSIAKKYITTNTSLSFDDLYQEGIIGVMKAVQRFDTERECKFSTYATWWIKQTIQRNMADNGRTIRLPVHVQENFQRLKKVQKALEQSLNREPTLEEIQNKVNIDLSCYYLIIEHPIFKAASLKFDTLSEDQIEDLETVILNDFSFNEETDIVLRQIITFMKKNNRVPSFDIIEGKINLSSEKISRTLGLENNISSLDISIGEDINATVGSNISSGELIEDICDKKSIEEGISKAIDEVFSNQDFEACSIPKGELLKRRFGVGGYEKETLQQLSTRYNVSRERVRQIEKNIIAPKMNTRENRLLKKKLIEYCNLDESVLNHFSL